MDSDGGMTWFRHEEYHAESPPECGWMVFKEGHGYVESDLKVSLEEAWPCVSLFISAATLHHIQSFQNCDRCESRRLSSRQNLKKASRRRRRRDGMVMYTWILGLHVLTCRSLHLQ